MGELTRRDSVLLLAGAAATLAAQGSFAQEPPSGLFRHGVASGDPTSDSIVLWTRVTTGEKRTPVAWQVASDPAFRSIVRQGEVVASSERDHTVKVVADRLRPGTRYFYRFRTREETSTAGRTRTLPTGRLDRLGIALMSCSNYSLGYFTTYDAIADDPAIDFLLHVGDYIYEYGNEASERSTSYVRPAEPPHETVTLDDYRRRHATHKGDGHSQRMHASHPMIAFWDDHDVANNSWAGGAENHHPATQGTWEARRDAAIRAFYEWMPIRDPAPGHDPLQYWRTYSFGDLATLVTLEERLTARGKQVDYADYKATIDTPAARGAFLNDVLGDPKRKMIADANKASLRKSLAASVADHQPWRLIGNGVLLARVLTPDFRKNGIRPEDYPELALLDKFTGIVWQGEQDLPLTTDGWDGYGGARREFYGACRDAGAHDLLVLTGDSHCFWSNALTDDDGTAMGVELGTAGISTPSDVALAGFGPELMGKLDSLLMSNNHEVRWTDSAHRGYVRVVLGRDRATADFVAVETTKPANYDKSVLRSEDIRRRGDTLVATRTS